MFIQLVVGSVLISMTVVIEAAFIGAAVVILEKTGAWLTHGRVTMKLMVSLAALTLWLLAGISVGLWLWAGLFYWLGQFETFELSLYFSVVAATTLGLGDEILSARWRLLSGFIAANGLVLFSLSTAFLIEAMRRLHDTRSIHAIAPDNADQSVAGG